MKLLISLTLIFNSLIIVSCGGKLTMDEQFPKPWRDPNQEEFISIGQTLVKNKIRNCGEYYVRPSSQDRNEYLVGCSPDGTNWTYYLVWSNIQKVMGPYSDTTIQKPR